METKERKDREDLINLEKKNEKKSEEKGIGQGIEMKVRYS